MYDRLGDAQEDADNTHLSRDEWRGRDRDAYDDRIDEYRSQMTGSKRLALAVGASLVIVGDLLMMVVAMMVVIATILLACMVYVLAAMAGVFTYAAALAQASGVADQCGTYMR